MSVEFGSLVRGAHGFHDFDELDFSTSPNSAKMAGRLTHWQQISKNALIEPIHQVIRTTIHPDRVGEYKKLMRADINGTRKEPGCLRFDMLQEKGTTNQFIIYETYASQEALNLHFENDHFKAVREFLNNGGGAMDIQVTKADAVDFQE